MTDSARPELQVILLNGGSRAGRTALARALQNELAGYWLRFGIDTLLEALPPRLLEGEAIAGGAAAGTPNPAFTAIEAHWRQGIAAIAASGGRVLVEVELATGPTTQQLWRIALEGIPTAWIGVRSPSALAAAQEFAHSDRFRERVAKGESVHRGISYDLVVDTNIAPPAETASLIRERLGLERAAAGPHQTSGPAQP